MSVEKNKTNVARTSVIAVIVVALVAVLVIMLRPAPQTETATPEAKTGKKLSAAEQTQALVNERMNDKEYRAILEKCQQEQLAIARENAALQKEIEGWIDANPKAKELLGKLEQLSAKAASGAEIDALRAEFEKLMASDPKGKQLRERQEELEREFTAAREKTADIVGARIRRQTAPAAKSQKSPEAK